MTVRELIEQHAKQHGYTGLYSSGNECGCDISKCCLLDSADVLDCEFGYKNKCDACASRDTCCDRDHDWPELYKGISCEVKSDAAQRD